ncbi:MAG: hypothetical protein V1799_16780 [bacterium]
MNSTPQPLPHQPAPESEGRAFIALLKNFSPFHFNIRRVETQVPEEVHRSMQYAVAEGAFSGIMAVFIGGVILTGFALSLGANDFVIGIIAAIQSGAHLFQMRAYRMIERRGTRKEIAVRYAALSRLLWIPICATVFITVQPFASYRIWFFLILFTIISIVLFMHSASSMRETTWQFQTSSTKLLRPIGRQTTLPSMERWWGLRQQLLL